MTVPNLAKRKTTEVTLAALEADLAVWHEREYGSATPLRPQQTFCKLVEEVGQAAEAARRVASAPTMPGVLALGEELADVCIVAFHLARAHGIDLGAMLLAKLEKIEARQDRHEPRDDAAPGYAVEAKSPPANCPD